MGNLRAVSRSFAAALPRACPRRFESRRFASGQVGSSAPADSSAGRKGVPRKRKGSGTLLRRCALETTPRARPPWTSVSPRNLFQPPPCGCAKSDNWAGARLDCRTRRGPRDSLDSGAESRCGPMRKGASDDGERDDRARRIDIMRPRGFARPTRPGAAPLRVPLARTSRPDGRHAGATRHRHDSWDRHCGPARGARRRMAESGSMASGGPGKATGAWNVARDTRATQPPCHVRAREFAHATRQHGPEQPLQCDEWSAGG